MHLLIKTFCIYFIWLAIAPCDDGGFHADSTPRETQIIQGEHNKTVNVFDSCSFFCLCNCCGAVIDLSVFDCLYPPQSLSEKKFITNTADPFYMNFPLLRPPKSILS